MRSSSGSEDCAPRPVYIYCIYVYMYIYVYIYTKRIYIHTYKHACMQTGHCRDAVYIPAPSPSPPPPYSLYLSLSRPLSLACAHSLPHSLFLSPPLLIFLFARHRSMTHHTYLRVNNHDSTVGNVNSLPEILKSQWPCVFVI